MTSQRPAYALRTVQLTACVHWPFVGNVVAAAVAVGDVDNDGHNEFVVGNIKGVLAVYKGLASTRPWKVCHNLGTITCVVIGDILNVKRNMLVCLTAEGWCHIFDMVAQDDAWDIKETIVLSSPTLTMPLPVNVARCAIGDVDGDGLNELIVAHTDRNLEAYRFMSNTQSSTTNIGTDNAVSDDQSSSPARIPRRKSLASRIELAEVRAVQLPGQSGSIIVTQTEQGEPVAMIAQPGGAFVTLDAQWQFHSETAPTDPNMGFFRGGAATELVSLQRPDNRGGNQIVMATIDGTLQMLNSSFTKVWELQLNQPLFCLGTVDINGDGRLEAVGCTWDGLTYIIDNNCNVVRFLFGTDVCAFTTGTFSQSKEHASTCLFYIDYSDQITVYHDVHLNYVAMRRFTDVFHEDILPQVTDMFELTETGVCERNSTGDRTPVPLRDFIAKTLYGNQIVSS